jgi:hypothetical protein
MRRSALLLAWTSLIACRAHENDGAAEEDESVFVQEGSETSAAETDTQLLASSLVSSAPGQVGLDPVGALYLPRSCVTVSDDVAASTKTYTFRDCLGPNGLRIGGGEIKARSTATREALHLELSGTEITVNDATVDWSATADIVTRGADRTMTWKARLDGTTPRGRPFTRTNEHTTAWKLGEPCFTLSGFSEGQINRRDVKVEISDFRRCRRGCPDPGGKVTITNVTRNKRFELRYDGSNVATYVGPNGREASVPLLCRP